jgi:hypothetical protein
MHSTCAKQQAEGVALLSTCIDCRYGGTVARDNVAVAADWFVYRIQAVLDALQ